MIRGIGTRGAVAVNVIAMIGIGPLITIPLVLAQLAGPLALVGWIAGAVVALCDGLVWAELGSRYPGSGGTYVYLREVFGNATWGRLLAFLFNWQFLLYAPFLLASGYIGFANYAGYFFPALAASPALHVAAAVGIGLLTIALLYRRIDAVASLSVALAVAAILTLLLVIAASLPHANFHRALTLAAPVTFGWGFLAGLGGALYITLYDYVGYSAAATLGDEVRAPSRTIPLATILSILIVAALYIALQVGVLGIVPWQELVGRNGAAPPPSAQYVAATVVQRTWGVWAAGAVTILILVTAFASLFGNLLGFSRIPYAAARDGAFLPIFARLHPEKQFPHVSLLAIGAISLCACFFSLEQVIAILTTGSVLIQNVAQIAALFALRLRGTRAPFRMWLFPLPALVALVGWLLAFAYAGALPIALGIGWLVVGIAAFLTTARTQRNWPFVARTAAALLLALGAYGVRPADAAWHASALVREHGYPVFAVHRKPFFVYAAAFFYERIPRSQWRASLQAYRELGINTIDLYVMWNWHASQAPRTARGTLRQIFDFTGRTNPRRDLVGLLKLIDAMGFKVILRPGPVIRNEWRNGGYPAWLLERPAYDMPLHDVLQGRYPATATLQNAHADDAAAEWMHNATHMRYAAQWLRAVLRAAAPWRRDVIAIALDDDQGAYIDNQTWPAPHWQAYVRYLKSVVQSVVGDRLPLFINTYQMKVTASAPVWAWGNWYQSDAYSIGEHDRAQLEFSTGLLQTQARLPVMISEFQAGWLQGAGAAYPRSADPTNTSLALHTLLQMGMHGVVNFPVQDTLDPAGWEAPWANAFYGWDAALSLELTRQARWAPTRRFGELLRAYGPLLARTHPVTDAAVAYLTSAYHAPMLSNAQIGRIAAATIAVQRGCRSRALACRLVDLRYDSVRDLLRNRVLIVPRTGLPLRYTRSAERKLAAFRRAGGRIVHSAGAARALVNPAAGGVRDATFLAADDGHFGFLDIVNYASAAMRTPGTRLMLGTRTIFVPPTTVPARGALLLPIGLPPSLRHPQPEPARVSNALPAGAIPLRDGAYVTGAHLRAVPRGRAIAYMTDAFADGEPVAVLENDRVRLIVSPDAGARSFVFEDKATRTNLFSTVGGLRDDVSMPLPPSPRDYIARYTHPMPAGFFNRPYVPRVTSSGSRASVRFSYDAPDAPPGGALFERVVTMLPNRPGFTVDERVRFHGDDVPAAQRPVVRTSFASGAQTLALELPDGCAFYRPSLHRVVLVAWPAGDVVARALAPERGNLLLSLTYARGGTRRTVFAVRGAATPAAARALLAAFSASIHPPQGRAATDANRR
ncbi:MAG: amino acid permease [Vulcanimicrobiaceae bacterium]